MATKTARRRDVDDPQTGERCPRHLIDNLAELGFNPEDVERWTAVKARHTLDRYKRDSGNAASKADGVALQLDGTIFPPPQAERLEVAKWIGATMGASDQHELVLALQGGITMLAADELARLATHLKKRLETVPELPESNSLLARKTAPARQDAQGESVGEVIDL